MTVFVDTHPCFVAEVVQRCCALLIDDMHVKWVKAQQHQQSRGVTATHGGEMQDRVALVVLKRGRERVREKYRHSPSCMFIVNVSASTEPTRTCSLMSRPDLRYISKRVRTASTLSCCRARRRGGGA